MLASRAWQCWLAACAVLAINYSSSLAATIVIDEVTAVPYSEFTTLHASDDQPTGVVEKYVPPAGSNLWLVTFRVTPSWDEATEEMSFDNETLGLYDGDQKVEHLGSMMSFGVIERYYGAPYLYRPENWKTEKPSSHWLRLWVTAPRDKTELTLRLTQMQYDKSNLSAPPTKIPHTAQVKLAGTPKPFDMNDHVEVRVRAVKMLESLEDQYQYDAKARPRQTINQGGSILQLTVQITPRQPNALDVNEFRWSPAWIGMSFGRGGRAVCIGTRQHGTLDADTTETIEQTDGEVWESKTVSLYFPVPSNLKTFDVTFLGQKVADGTIP